MIVYLCSCGFATDDPDWFDGHQDQHPDHHQRRMVRDSPASSPIRLCSPSAPRILGGVQRDGATG
jgi:hypothetical protein